MIEEITDFEYSISFKNKKEDEDFDYKLKSYYNFISENQDVLEDIYYSILDIKSYKFEKQKEFVKEFKFESKYNIIILMYSVSILKSFEDNYPINKGEISDEINYNFTDSDKIINLIILNINKILIWLTWIKHKKDIVSIDYLFSLDNQKDRSFIYKIVRFNLDKVIRFKLLKLTSEYHKYLCWIDKLKKTNKIHYISRNKYEIIKLIINNSLEIYQISNHHSSVDNVIIKNINNKNNIIIDNMDELYSKIQNIDMYIDISILKKNLDIMMEDYNKKAQLNIKAENTRELYYKILEKSNNILTSGPSSKYYPLIQKECSLLNKIANLYEISKIDFLENNKIYLPIKFDFRGRFYYFTTLSPTFIWEIRSCIYYGIYNNFDIHLKKSKHIEKIRNLLYENWCLYEIKIKKIYPSITNNRKVKESIIWILISIGKVIIKVNNEKYKIKISDFIENALEYINNRKNIDDLGKRIELNYYLTVLNEIDSGIYKKRPLFKDATASVFQHMIKIYGYIDDNSLKCTNLASDEWCDTYTEIIVSFLSKQNIKNLSKEDISSLFNRNTLKKTIMTEKYTAGLKKCTEYFGRKISENNIIKNNTKRKEIYSLHRKFYIFLKKIEIFEKDLDYGKEYFEKNDYKFTLFDGRIDIKYFKRKKEQFEIKKKEKRISKRYYSLTEEMDINETRKGSLANYIHSQDAAFARRLCSIHTIISIHDCFMVDYLSTTEFISIANDIFKEKFDKNIENKNLSMDKYSIFILI